MNLLTKQKQILRHRKQTYGYQRGSGGRINQKFGINRSTLLYIKQINNKDLLYITGNYIQYLVIIYKQESEKEYICVHIYMNHFVVHRKLTHCKSTILQYKNLKKTIILLSYQKGSSFAMKHIDSRVQVLVLPFGGLKLGD